MGQCLRQLYRQIWRKGAYHLCCSDPKSEELLQTARNKLVRIGNPFQTGAQKISSLCTRRLFLTPAMQIWIRNLTNFITVCLLQISASCISIQMSYYKLKTHGSETLVFKIIWKTRDKQWQNSLYQLCNTSFQCVQKTEQCHLRCDSPYQKWRKWIDLLCRLGPDPVDAPLGMTGIRACCIAISHIRATSMPIPPLITLLFSGTLERLSMFSPT